jgi:phosphatidylserine/phosphatidylglycerophosphate/cardiolipin synthase-like enzyme
VCRKQRGIPSITPGMGSLTVSLMKKLFASLFFLAFLFTFPVSLSMGLPVEDLKLVTDGDYFQTAMKMIQEAKSSIHIIMFEMNYYDDRTSTPSNLLIKELMAARKRGVKVEVILDVREKEDRTTKSNRRTGKMLSDGGVEVTYDSLSKTTHAKVLIADGQRILLGSTNWTYHALSSNHEACVLIHSREVAKELTEYFNRVKAEGRKR